MTDLIVDAATSAAMNATRDPRILERDVRQCREPSCRAEVFFAVTPNNKTCPIDVEPTTDPKTARYFLAAWQIDRPNPSMPRYLLGAKKEAEPDDALFSSHFSTCRAPSQFSKKGHHGNL